MSKLLTILFLSTLSTISIAATTQENKDDASSLGTSENPQVQQQQNNTDKEPIVTNDSVVIDDQRSMESSDAKKTKDQAKHNKNGSINKSKHNAKNKVMKEKEMNSGTSKGNPIQPTEPESAPPASN